MSNFYNKLKFPGLFFHLLRTEKSAGNLNLLYKLLTRRLFLFSFPFRLHTLCQIQMCTVGNFEKSYGSNNTQIYFRSRKCQFLTKSCIIFRDLYTLKNTQPNMRLIENYIFHRAHYLFVLRKKSITFELCSIFRYQCTTWWFEPNWKKILQNSGKRIWLA